MHCACGYYTLCTPEGTVVQEEGRVEAAPAEFAQAASRAGVAMALARAMCRAAQAPTTGMRKLKAISCRLPKSS